MASGPRSRHSWRPARVCCAAARAWPQAISRRQPRRSSSRRRSYQKRCITSQAAPTRRCVGKYTRSAKRQIHTKKAAFRRPFRSSAASGSSGSQSGPVLSAAIPHEAQDAEAEKHHPPCRRQGSRRGDGQTSIGDAVRADTREP